MSRFTWRAKAPAPYKSTLRVHPVRWAVSMEDSGHTLWLQNDLSWASHRATAITFADEAEALAWGEACTILPSFTTHEVRS